MLKCVQCWIVLTLLVSSAKHQECAKNQTNPLRIANATFAGLTQIEVWSFTRRQISLWLMVF